MRLSELLAMEAVDETGAHVGRVHDVRVRQDGPVGAGYDAALQVTGLIVGTGGMAHRLGYRWSRSRGPWLLRVLMQRRRRPRFVPWERIRTIEATRLVVSGRGEDLPPAEPLRHVAMDRSL